MQLIAKNRFECLGQKRGIVLRRLTGSELVLSCDKKDTGHGPIHPLPAASSSELTGGEPLLVTYNIKQMLNIR